MSVTKEVFRQVKNLFIWASDQEHYGVPDKWMSFADEVERGEVFKQDCDGFSLTCAELLVRRGVPKAAIRIALCWTETGGYHAVCVCRDEVLDNRQRTVKGWDQLRGYRWDKSMGLEEPGIWRTV
jgi:predicted transglutaminase-like cysteine proteinase